MSRFTQPPFKKLSPFDLTGSRPYHPLSPPETEVTADSIAIIPPHDIQAVGAAMDTSSSYMKYSKVDAVDSYVPSVPMPMPETGGKYRRPSNLQYHSSSSIRSDQLQRPRSATRWLVMVIPPPAVAQEHGTGDLLNAAARTNHGILLPLFSNMSGQLTAIAREFGFPSTAGICIFLHMADNGLNFTPRVSDESWSLLWGNVFDDRHGSHQISALPIAGRIEFDLDLRKARWYDVWVSNCRREFSRPSPPQTLAFGFGHGHQESRTTTDLLPESLAEDASMHIQRRVPIIRHIPRKLSLLDRIDVKALSQPASRVALSPVDIEQITMQIPLSNIPHEGDQTPRGRTISRVDDKIESWRASSLFAKSPFPSSHGQTALDPVNMPNNMALPDVDFNGAGSSGAEGEEREELPLNLEDFAWSISSAGPPSADFLRGDSPIEWGYGRGRAPSVHLDGRLEGSVCLTPSTCTSFGPPDYNHFDYAPSLISRLPSPDIAARALSDCPPTPMTATSWGAPSVWPDSPPESFRAPSVDIAARYLHSRPVTPGTATSWGAPLDWPSSPAARSIVHTPGVGQMFFDDEYEEEELLKPGRKTNESEGVWRHVWPYIKFSEMPRTECAAQPERLCADPREPASPKQTSSPHSLVQTRLDSGYPHIVIYPAVYPNFDLYPAKAALVGWTRDIVISLKSNYPVMSIYPAVYPAFEIYPGHVVEPQTNARECLRVRLNTVYPNICVYEPVYPNLVIYPDVRPSSLSAPLKRRLRKSTRLSRPLSIQEAMLLKKTCEMSVKLEKYYPFFRLYPAVYPANLDEIYPPIALEQGERRPINDSTSSVRGITTKLTRSYPNINIYPAAYPHLEIYPPVLQKASPAPQVKTASKRRTPPPVPSRRAQVKPKPIPKDKYISTRLRPGYPVIDIYSPVYPHLEIYPSLPSPALSKRVSVSVTCNASYPHFDIYPAVYPYFDIYRSGTASTPQYWREPQPVELQARYPAMVMYPAVYPFFDIYKSGKICNGELLSGRLGVKLQAKYPCFDIYPAVYPHFDVYPSLPRVDSVTVTHAILLKPRRNRKTHEQIVEAFLAKQWQTVPLSRVSAQSRHVVLPLQETPGQPIRPRKTHAQIVEKILAQSSTRVPIIAIQEPEWEMMSFASPVIERVVLQRPEKPRRRPSDLEFRRSMSLNRAASDRPSIPRGPRLLESSESAAAITRSSSLSRIPSMSTVKQVTSTSGPASIPRSSPRKTPGASRRDSLVLEAARKWGSQSYSKPPQPLQPQAEELSINDLDEFPLPPVPEASSFPEIVRPLGARPVSKLDRSKFPFH